MNPGIMLIPILVLFAYLLGSLPFSQLITSWRTGLNLREVGEGSVGSRNVWHVVGPEWGLVAFALDAFNVLNRANDVNYVGTLGSPLFGQPVAALAPRQLQVSARVKF